MLPFRKLSYGYLKQFKHQPKRFLSDKSSNPNPDYTKKQLDNIISKIDALVFLNGVSLVITIIKQL